MKRLTAIILCLLLIGGIFSNPSLAAKAKRKATSKSSSPAKIAQVTQKLIEVQAEGIAPVIDGRRADARQAALYELNRDALDKAIGSFVASVTKIENYQAVSDKVFSQAQGLVKKVEVVREWVDEENMMHVIASCGVAEKALDGVLGPAVIDALGNPRILIIIDNPTVQSVVRQVFEKAGYMIINRERAERLQEIDEDYALAINDPAKRREVARDAHAEVLIVGSGTSRQLMVQSIYGQKVYKVASSVRLEAVLADTSESIGFFDASWQPSSYQQASFSYSEGAGKGLNICANEVALEMVNKIAYALTSGRAGSIPGRTINVLFTNMDFGAFRNVKNSLLSISGINSVEQRRFSNGELQADIVLNKTTEDLAGILYDLGYEITGMSGSSIEARRKE